MGIVAAHCAPFSRESASWGRAQLLQLRKYFKNRMVNPFAAFLFGGYNTGEEFGVDDLMVAHSISLPLCRPLQCRVRLRHHW